MSHDENAFRTQSLHVSQKGSLANLFENSNKDYTQQWRQWRPEITTWAAFIDMVHFIFSN